MDLRSILFPVLSACSSGTDLDNKDAKGFRGSCSNISARCFGVRDGGGLLASRKHALTVSQVRTTSCSGPPSRWWRGQDVCWCDRCWCGSAYKSAIVRRVDCAPPACINDVPFNNLAIFSCFVSSRGGPGEYNAGGSACSSRYTSLSGSVRTK